MKKLSDLNPHPGNPRKITDEALLKLKKSLAEFGDLSGIIYNRTTNRLIGGHQRLKVLPPDIDIQIEDGANHGHFFLGNDKFLVRFVDWDETKEKAANIAANQHGGEWEYPLLCNWINELDSANIDMDLLGFGDEELKAMMDFAPSPVAGLTDDDAVPEPPKEPKTKLGDIYELGNHRLMCGDCTVKENMERLMAGEKVDMVFTDPPYGVSEQTNRKSKGRSKLAECNDFSPVYGDNKPYDPLPILNFDCPKIVWGANYFAKSLPEAASWIVWDKRDGIGSNDNADCELAWTDIGGPARIFRHLWNGMIKASEQGEKRVHPTQKPIALAEWCFERLKNVHTITDLYLGSGSTIIACEKTNRRCLGMEIDPIYCDVIVKRWEEFTGKTAKLIT